jgi:hypothetical protein
MQKGGRSSAERSRAEIKTVNLGAASGVPLFGCVLRISALAVLSPTPRAFATKKQEATNDVLIAPTSQADIEFYFSSCAAMLMAPPVTFILRCQSL